MQHLFDIDIATQYGVDIAIFLKNLHYWLFQNAANNINYHDGRYWSYNTRKAFSIIFPYWTPKQIRRITDSAVSLGLVLQDSHNRKKYDQTIWYSLTDKGMDLFEKVKSDCPNGQMRQNGASEGVDGLSEPVVVDLPKRANESDQMGKPIPNALALNKHKSKDMPLSVDKSQKKKAGDESLKDELPEWLPLNEWLEFLQHRKDIRKPASISAQKRLLAELGKLRNNGNDPCEVINNSIMNRWTGLFPVKKITTPNLPTPSAGQHHVHPPRMRDVTQERLDREEREENERLSSGN